MTRARWALHRRRPPQAVSCRRHKLEKDIARRTATMEELGHQLIEALAAIDPVAAKVVRPTRLPSDSVPAVNGDRPGSSRAGALAQATRRRWLLPLGAVAVLAAAATLLVGAHRATPARRAARKPPPPRTTARAALPPSPPLAPPDAAPPARARVVRLTSRVPDAEAFTADGTPLGLLPVELSLPRDAPPTRVVVRAEGHQPREVDVGADERDVIDVVLRRARRHSAARKAAKRKGDIVREW